MPTKEMVQLAFTDKNRRRKDAKQRSRAEFRQGRSNRRAFAWKGAFGNEVARIYNDCVLGTSGQQREVKAGADEFDSASDYDD